MFAKHFTGLLPLLGSGIREVSVKDEVAWLGRILGSIG